MTIIALTCVLVVGAAAASILGRDSVPAAGPEMAMASATVPDPVSNRESKGDRLAVAVVAPALFEPPQTGAIPSEPLRQAFAATPSADIEGLKIADPVTPPKPKLVSKPPAQKSYALLSDVQIAGIKERLKLSSDQESYWPAVENALRAVARKIHATRQADPNGTGAPIIDPDAEEVQQLKSAAMPLLFQLREDQKREVRQLARLIGLEKVAAAI
ncbi:hypothetical protein GALL_471920 [mine drainage metagenome]|uniref:Uncharacterized protein n=1 Tax=mine drainage metagenome TaxID=410659 RepID=A0A1J5PTX6_9ZZZZ